MPLGVIMSKLQAEDLLLDFEYAEVTTKRNIMDRRQIAIDYFLTKDELSIQKLNDIVQSCPGYSHLDLRITTPVVTSRFLRVCRDLKDFCRFGYPIHRQFPPVFPPNHNHQEPMEMNISKRNYGDDGEGIDSGEITGTSVDDVVSKAVRIQSSADLLSMLNQETAREIIIVEGVAGVGKSFLAFRIAQEWASDRLDSYVLVVLIELPGKQAAQFSTLEQLLKYAHGLQSSHDVKTVADEIRRRRGKGVLFLFDGADGVSNLFTKRSATYFWKLVSRQVLECMYCSVLITTRPTVTFDLRRVATLHINIDGLSDQSVENILSKWDARGRQVSTQLYNHAFLRLLCKVPLYLGAAIHCSHIGAPANITDLFETFTVSLVLQRSSDGEGLRFHHLSAEDQSLLVTAGKDAYTMITNGVYTFEKADLSSPEIVDKLRTLSLLTCDVSSAGKNLQFTHQMFKEFLSALYLSKLTGDELRTCLETDIFLASDGHSRFAIIFRFLAGLTKLTSQPFQDSSLSLSQFLKPDPMKNLPWTLKLQNFITILHGVHESQNQVLLNQVIIPFCQNHRFFQERMVVLRIPVSHLYDALDFSTLSYAINRSTIPWAVTLNSCNVSKENLGMLCCEATAGKGLKEIKLDEATVTDYGVDSLCAFFRFYQSCLCSISLVKLGGCFPDQMFNGLAMHNLQVLELRNCNLTSESITAISQCGVVSTLSKLTISDNPGIAESVSVLLDTLLRNSSLQFLDVGHCELGSTGTAALTSYTRRSNLQQLWFEDSTPTVSDINGLLNVVPSSKLTKLRLAECFQKRFSERQKIGNCEVVFGLGVAELISTDQIDGGQRASFFNGIRNFFGL
jgi:hypothetical protein